MSKREKDLPQPKKSPSGRKRNEGEEQNDLLMADKMALAAAEGKLEEYLNQELPEGEYAKKLAIMMMNMTGTALPQQGETPEPLKEAAESAETEEAEGAKAVPEDVVKAVKAADVELLKGLLVREARKRDPHSGEEQKEDESVPQAKESGTGLEKGTLDDLISVASENNISLDWLIARALKLYLKDYKKTGRL
jgi:hypothetical protein